MPDPFDKRESATEPDLATVACPECSDAEGDPQGSIQVTRWSPEKTHTTTRPEPCPVCRGARTISQDRLAWYRAQPRR